MSQQCCTPFTLKNSFEYLNSEKRHFNLYLKACQSDDSGALFYDLGRQDSNVQFAANEGYVTIMYRAADGSR
jgi:hypothetical protein